MSSYWISGDGTAQAETLESFLYRHAKQMQVTNHQLTVLLDESGDMQLVIQLNADSTDRLEFKVDDNQLYPADPAFAQESGKTLLFMVSGDGRVFKLESTGWYLNMLERLYKAVKEKNEASMQELVKAIENWEEEWA